MLVMFALPHRRWDMVERVSTWLRVAFPRQYTAELACGSGGLLMDAQNDGGPLSQLSPGPKGP